MPHKIPIPAPYIDDFIPFGANRSSSRLLNSFLIINLTEKENISLIGKNKIKNTNGVMTASMYAGMIIRRLGNWRKTSDISFALKIVLEMAFAIGSEIILATNPDVIMLSKMTLNEMSAFVNPFL